jgi:glutathione S-transferase
MYKLYNIKGWGSMGVQFLLDDMGVAYESVWLTGDDVRKPEFRSISPLGLIPALGLPDGRTLFESAAIFTYLVVAHPDSRMAPQPGTYDFGLFLSWLNYLSTNVYTVTSMAYAGGGFGENDAQNAAIKRKAVDVMTARFAIVDDKLKTQGPYMLGKVFSALDIYLFMLTIWGMPGEAEVLQQFKQIAKVSAAVRARPKLQASLVAHGVHETGSYHYG